MIDKAKIRKAHKVYTNEDGVLMCEMEHSKYLKLCEALTPPTAEEVCKALSEWHKNFYEVDEANYIYLNDGRWAYFKLGSSMNSIAQYYIESDYDSYPKHKSVLINNSLPPHLITLIGRFYEGEIK